MQEAYKSLLPQEGLILLQQNELSLDLLAPPAKNGNTREHIIVSMIIIEDLKPMTKDELKICGCDVNHQTLFDHKGYSGSEVIIDKWYYIQMYQPEFTIGLTLRQLDIAETMAEESVFAKYYQIFVRLNRQEGLIILGEKFSEAYREFELKTIEDSDKYTRPYCTLVLRKRPGLEKELTQAIKGAKKQTKKNQAPIGDDSSQAISFSDESPVKQKKIKAKQARKGSQFSSDYVSDDQSQSVQFQKSKKPSGGQTQDSLDYQRHYPQQPVQKRAKVSSKLDSKKEVPISAIQGSQQVANKSQKTAAGEKITSRCGKFQKYLNPLGVWYLQDLQNNDIMGKDLAVQRIYKTLDDINNELIKSIHDVSPFRYFWNVTPKYLQLRCSQCAEGKYFAYWYKNKDNIPMKDLYTGDGKKKFIEPKGDLDLQAFRVIQKNHLLENHPEILF